MQKDDFAERLRSSREALRLTQDQLAKLVDRRKTQSLIGNLESRARNSTTYLPEIAHALGVDAYWLKTGKGEKHPGGLGRRLTSEQETLLAALPLISPDLRESWLDAARKALARSQANAA